MDKQRELESAFGWLYEKAQIRNADECPAVATLARLIANEAFQKNQHRLADIARQFQYQAEDGELSGIIFRKGNSKA